MAASAKKPFAKRKSVMSPLLIALLLALNFSYAYAIGIPLPRMVVASYVESVEAAGNAQVQGYLLLGSAVAAVAALPATMNLAGVAAYTTDAK